MRYNFGFSYTFCIIFCKTVISVGISWNKVCRHSDNVPLNETVLLLSVHPNIKLVDYFLTDSEIEEDDDNSDDEKPTTRKRGRPRKDEVVVKPIKMRKRGPQKSEEEYMVSSDYPRKNKTTIERTRKRRAARHHCILCGVEVVTSNIVRHLSLEHCYPLKLRRYILDVTRIRHQQKGKNTIINDCTTCLRRFVKTRSHSHHSSECELVQVPDFKSLDGLCLRAKAIMAVCDGDLNNAFELLGEELGRD